MALKEYEMVRVRQLLRAAEEYDGWRFNQRPPRVGDVGYIVDVLHADGVPDNYVVESSGPDGITVWLGDFSEDELEPLP
jgi:hypothetical protein